MPHEIAATWSRNGSATMMLRVRIQARQSCSATQAPVIAAVRVPPSAWITSQSTVICRSPRAVMSTTARSERPIRRWISWVRPLWRPLEASRRVRSKVARGSMPYSAVIQPRPWPLSQGGRRSSKVAVTSTWVSPNFTKQDPSAYLTTARSKVTARSSSGSRRLGRIASPHLGGAGLSPRRLLEHFPEKSRTSETGRHSRPRREAQAGSGSGGRPVARDVLEPFEMQVLDGAGQCHPVEDFRAAGLQLVARKVLEEAGVLVGARLQDGAVELLVHQEMAQASGSRNTDARFARIGFDGRAPAAAGWAGNRC